MGGVLFFCFIKNMCMSCFLSTIMVSVGIFTLGGEFGLDQTSHLFYKCITVGSTILLYHVYGRWFILFFLRFNIGRSTNIEC